MEVCIELILLFETFHVNYKSTLKSAYSKWGLQKLIIRKKKLITIRIKTLNKQSPDSQNKNLFHNCHVRWQLSQFTVHYLKFSRVFDIKLTRRALLPIVMACIRA